ncbi:MAG: ComF family protein [Verrucomicrobiota bacterium]
MSGSWVRARRWAEDKVFPPVCVLCRVGGLAGSLCEDCLATLPRVREPFCRVCGEHFEGAFSGAFSCSNCRERQFSFAFARAPFLAEGRVRTWIHEFKFDRRFHRRGLLADLLVRVWERPEIAALRADAPLVVPVPLHWRRRWRRGFDQAAELAYGFARRSGLRWAKALRRVRATETQSALPREVRLQNMRKAFALRPSQREKLRGATVLLVDDVFTTGATVQACAEVLLAAGVRKCVVITLARG